MSDSVPSGDAVILAMLLRGREWLFADEVHGALRRLGFTLSPQKVSGILSRLRREEFPMVESRPWPCMLQYKVTNHGRVQLGNRFPVLHSGRDSIVALRVERGERES